MSDSTNVSDTDLTTQTPGDDATMSTTLDGEDLVTQLPPDEASGD